ncbi:imidazole glycerol phosphate synthase, glutamine amidotransferase subunit [Candidatus Nitrosopumilus koreensis AR1]|uniref:Imidazole glycerol phosphate synthase subunit HisH n=1 Tax=Candidatus Nitrosopumilus koreensis AR1 TaxID=1229908 RepID=K0B8T8_9ARCH|nr:MULTISPECIES: imidazole glycerol phosphate synthase subunit HisH [Nitrosopumilus]AFS81547.1 imidazole glycerol phosphate synthase, glutamine amidotransferase subunit [Candidatus Nitrosopumilus koreensis AR1]
MTKIAIFDYGAGNIFSLKNALEKQNATVEVQTQVDKLTGYDGIFLPGVGNFDPAIQSINRDSVDFLQVVGSTPVFGICLGMEMFFEKSQEGKEKGLGIIDGDVIVLPDTLKVPHMGWNALEIKQENKILEGVENNSWVYFVHSYRANPKNLDVIVAESDYDVKVPSIVQKENYFGTQFHPEKSGDVGALMLKNFLRECSK